MGGCIFRLFKEAGRDKTGHLLWGSECGTQRDRSEESKDKPEECWFTDEERAKFSALLDAGFIDTYRYFYPDTEGIYSWWSYRFKAREKNAGWRIDYFCTSKALEDRLEGAKILTDVFGSDHCPVELDLR